MTIPASKLQMLNQVLADLTTLPNISAIVLGGSMAMGNASASSDIDLGLYYFPDKPFDIEQVKAIAAKYQQGEGLTGTGFYGWGPWVNGGAWIHTSSGEMDFIYRNLDQVETTIEKAMKGIWENDFEQQPPYGFSSVIYLAETHYCQVLYDPQDIILRLKALVLQYPQPLKNAIVQQSLWAAEFALWQADKFAGKQDVYNTMGCFTRVMKKIIDALFALNERYPMGDKRAVEMIAQMPHRPVQLAQQVNSIFAIAGNDLSAAVLQLRNLFEHVVLLAGPLYKPYFQL